MAGDKGKKQVPLRISEELYNKLCRWADSDFRSVNGQIEFLLHECVKQHDKNGRYVPDRLFDSEYDGAGNSPCVETKDELADKNAKTDC